jgi:hypothetical protein
LTNNHDYDSIRLCKYSEYTGGGIMLKDKKVVLLGDRDGIPGPAMEECLKTTGAEVVFSTTECFV